MTKVTLNKAVIAKLKNNKWDEWFWRVKDYWLIGNSSNENSQSQALILEAIEKGREFLEQKLQNQINILVGLVENHDQSYLE